MRKQAATAHPAKGILAVRRIPIRVVANQIGMSPLVVGRQLNKRDRTTLRFRRALSQLLNVAESELFNSESSDSIEALALPARSRRRGAVAR